ncbi:hypothetical protein CHLNCDRAFT_51428 [Chlorella variabilis]|uniref:Bromo domain-containing protein n=1 Tax=Chlorella variabilis TaxID=554065 RepID=E1ZAT4_CHLVA|nr:hypothetical protein CHLNCDRAFT_51428 [Chlorella variabilis]EFN57112.1 hypothetical protein CHLNCDRAFT_51428 [Chlorella variabilis]|eukprot:XP_005849214.1 hypothetical protein CHLNCDRAFT_51428 [Chlorella variabilis]
MPVQEEVAAGAPAAAARAAPGAPPRLPETSKELLRKLAEELLLLNGQAEAAEARAAAAQQALDSLATQGGAAAQLQPERRQAVQQVEEERRRAEAAEQREAAAQRRAHALEAQLAECSAQLAAHAQAAAELRQQLGEEQRRAREAGQQIRHLEAQLEQLQEQLQQAQQQQAQQAQQQQAQQQAQPQQAQPQQAQQQQAQQTRPQQRVQAAAPPAPAAGGQRQQERAQPQPQPQPQRQRAGLAPAAAAPAAAAGQAGRRPGLAVVEAADGSQGSSIRRSSDDDETFSEPAAVEGPPAQQRPQNGGAVAATAAGGAAAAMRPPPRRLAGLKGPLPRPQAQAGGNGGVAGKRLGEGQGAAQAAKQRRLDIPPADSTSPGESALGAAAVLDRGLTRSAARPASAAAANGGGASGGRHLAFSPSLDGAREGLTLLMSLKDGAAAEQLDGGRRGGRRAAAAATTTTSGSGGGSVLRGGESAQQWLNRAAGAYVQSLLRESTFKKLFGQPVPRDTPQYHQIIANPMDLGTIKAKASRGGYLTPRQLLDDLQLVVANAKTFNVSPKHHVHRAADQLLDQLYKPHSFCTKVEELFQQAELETVVAQERAAQEEELEAIERQLAASVRAGLNVAVYGEDDEQRNYYYLLQAISPVETLSQDECDDFGQEYKRGDTVLKGHYWDYWMDSQGRWDRARRPYYLQESKVAFVPASALLLVDIQLAARPEVGRRSRSRLCPPASLPAASTWGSPPWPAARAQASTCPSA